MSVLTIKEQMQSMENHANNNHNSLVISQQQKKDWERIFVESELAQRQQNDCGKKDCSFQDMAGDDHQSGNAGRDLLRVDNKLYQEQYPSIVQKDLSDVVQSVNHDKQGVQDGVCCKGNHYNTDNSELYSGVVTEDSPMPASLTNQQPRWKLTNIERSSGSPVIDSNYFARAIKVGKTGLHFYQTEKGELKIWMRDGSLSKQQGLAIIKDLRGVFSKMGISLMNFTLNGEELYQDDHKIESRTEGEVTI